MLVEIVTVARRLDYMAQCKQLRTILARVHPHLGGAAGGTRAGPCILAIALSVPLVIANAATLAVFPVVDLALWD